ncbi:hypothetical protein NM688_g7031 [Phlebia brevispora]|uniref:Uncharacterized protein n=1 Tax=Phlebia brevispora TaxID=194682 RepID=A0ACC1S9T1_9APHY|nr:hypothetical protein NM688_g7031 [Phlebia brevispora]
MVTTVIITFSRYSPPSTEIKEDVKFDTLDLLRDPAVAAKHVELHKQGAGLHTTGIIGFVFATLAQITPKAEELYQSIKDMVSKIDFSNAPPSLKQQYEILLERFDPKTGSPGCEFISFPGFLSFPSKPSSAFLHIPPADENAEPPEPGKRYITIFAASNHPFSRGTIHSTSADPTKDPDFDPRYFEKNIDLDVLVEMCKFARQIANTSPFKDMVVKELNPGLEVQTDEQWREWIKPSFSTTWHTSSSCSMLPREKEGVVDPSLKVYGTENLRVVDLSVVPLQFAAHPQAVVYGVAEQAADIIKGKFTA